MPKFLSLKSVSTSCLGILLLATSGCQSTSSENTPPTKDRTRIVALYTINDSEPHKQADSITWEAADQSGTGLLPQIHSSHPASTTYSVTIDLRNPLGSDTLHLSLWKNQIRIMQLDYLAKDDKLDLASVPRYDELALEIHRSSNGSITSRDAFLEFYAKWLLAADSRTTHFPTDLPVGLTRDEVVRRALIEAAKDTLPLEELAKSWTLDLSEDSARMLMLELIASKTVTSKDSAELFPPPPIRITSILALDAPYVVAGGDPVQLSGEYRWSHGLGQVSLRAAILSGSDTIHSISIAGLPVPSPSDTQARLEPSAKLFATSATPAGDYDLVVSASDSEGHSANQALKFRVEQRAPLSPTIRLLAPADQAEIPFDDTLLAIRCLATTPQGKIDSVTINGIPTKQIDDSIWSGSLTLPPTGRQQSIVLRAWNSAGLSTTEVVTFARKRDSIGPILVWISPLDSSVVEYGVAKLTVRLKVDDLSGIDSVSANGFPMDSSQGEFRTTIPLRAAGTSTTIFVIAKDRAGNVSTSTTVVFRNIPPEDQPPAIRLVHPSTRVGTNLPFETDSIELKWVITSFWGIAPQSVRINGQLATNTSDSTWMIRLPLPPSGQPTSFTLVASTRNGTSAGDQVFVARGSDTIRPWAQLRSTIPPIPFDTASVLVKWQAGDNHKVDSVWIETSRLPPAVDSLYSSRIQLLVGANVVRLRIRDSTGNTFHDSLILERRPDSIRPTIVIADTPQTIEWTGRDSITLSLIVADNDSPSNVNIGGFSAQRIGDWIDLPINVGIAPPSYRAGRYQSRIPLYGGENLIIATASDPTGNHSTDTFKISVILKDRDGNAYQIRRMPDGRTWMTLNLRTKPTSEATLDCIRSDCQQFGANYSWVEALALPDQRHDSMLSGVAIKTPHQGICPDRWHIPSRVEWQQLFASSSDQQTSDSAHALKTDTGWTASPGYPGGLSYNGTNRYTEFLRSNGYRTQKTGPISGILYSQASFWLPESDTESKRATVELIAETIAQTPTWKSRLFGDPSGGYVPPFPVAVRCLADSD